MPCHNAARIIDGTLNEMISNMKLTEEIILIENGSTDETYSLLELHLKKYPKSNIRIARSEKGLGNAIRMGINLASGSYIVFMADDLPFGLQELIFARQRLQIDDTKWNIISKYHTRTGVISYARVQGWAFIALRELILNLKVRDSQATFFAEGSLAKKISQLSSEEGYLITTELIAIVRKLQVEVSQIPCGPVYVSARKRTVNIIHAGRMFIGLFRLRSKIKELKPNE
jgi:dolichyl-phosphate beta-glucosyltransferase